MLRKWCVALGAFCMAILLLAGCGASPLQYNADAFTFDYPNSWRTFADFYPAYRPGTQQYMDLKVTDAASVGDPSTEVDWAKCTTCVTIGTMEAPSGALEAFLSDVYGSISDLQLISSSTPTVDGAAALQRIYERDWGGTQYRLRDVWVPNGNTVYVISCKALPETFDAARKDFDLIVRSFRVW